MDYIIFTHLPMTGLRHDKAVSFRNITLYIQTVQVWFTDSEKYIIITRILLVFEI